MWKRVKNKLNKIGAGTIKKHHSKRPIPLKTKQAHIATGVLYTAWHYIHDTGSSVFFFAQHFGATALFIRLLACPAKLELRQPEKMPTTDRRSQGPNHMQMFSFWRPMAWLALRRWPTQSWSLNINVNSKCCKKKKNNNLPYIINKLRKADVFLKKKALGWKKKCGQSKVK